MPQYSDAMNQKNRLQNILAYGKLAAALLLMFAMAYAFTFHLDGDIGVVVFSFLIIAPLLSILLAVFAKKRVSMQLRAPEYIAKGRQCSVQIQLRADGFLPIPFLRIRLAASAALQVQDDRAVQTALSPKQPQEIEFPMTALHDGCANASLSQAEVSDYLGLLHFPLENLPQCLKIGVIPPVPSLTNAGVLLHSVSDAVLTQDEEEEESAAAFSSVSMPGYIHRDYVEGDSLRRINWKLSAKRGKLMVRMDEAASAVRPVVVLDLRMTEDEQELSMRDTLIEGALGFLVLLVQQGIACTLRYATEGNWQQRILETEDAVRETAVELATADFRNDGFRIDRSALQDKAGAYLIYTANPDAVLAQELAEFHDHGHISCIVPEQLQLTQMPHTDALWTIAADFTMTAVQK